MYSPSSPYITDELRADEGKMVREEHKCPFRRPLRPSAAKYNKQYRQAKTRRYDNAARKQAQQAQRRRRQAGHRVIHQVNGKTHKRI